MTESLSSYKESESPSPNESGCLAAWEKFSEYLRRPLSSAIVLLSRTCAIHPLRTVILTLVVSFTLALSGLYTNFYLETNVNVLWAPVHSLPVTHGHWVEHESGFPRPNRNVQFLIHAQGDNVLTKEGSSCLFDVMEVIQTTEGYQSTCNESSWGREDCTLTAASGLFHHNRTLFEMQLRSLHNDTAIITDHDVQRAMSAMVYPDGKPVVRRFIFGYPQSEDKDESTLQFAASYLGIVELPSQMEISQDFEAAVTDALYNLNDRWDSSSLSCFVEVQTTSSYEEELERGLAEDTPYMAVALIVMVCFCAGYFSKCSYSNCIQSQSLLGLGAVMTMVLSVMTAYGLLFCIGIPFTSISQVFPFVMVGIGLDDTFIIYQAYLRCYPNNKNIIDRVTSTMENVGVSIAFSTLTTVVAFLLGSLSSLPTARWFCWYAAATVAVDFLYQITFFVALLVYDDYRIREKRYDCLVCFVSRKASSNDEERPRELGESSTENNYQENPVKKLMTMYSKLLLRPTSKVIVLVAFTVLLALGILGATQQEQEMDIRTLTPPDSFIRTYFDALHTYSATESNGFLTIGVYFRFVDVSSPLVQDQMDTYVNDLVDTEYFPYQPDFFWLRDFQTFVGANDTTIAKNISFNDQVDLFLQTQPFADIYRGDIVRDKNGTVVASRCHITLDESSLLDTKVQVESLLAQREVSETQPINQGQSERPFFAFDDVFYIWELYSIIVDEVLVNVVYGLVSVFCISAIFIPHPIGPLLLTPVVGAIYCELVGLLYIAGIRINCVSVISLYTSIGLVVDYNAHIVLSYFQTKEFATRNERVHKVLSTMGTSILLGGFTTFLGVIPLSITGSEVFRTFFFTFLGITSLSSLHGIVFLPVVLSLLGPQESHLEQQRHKDTSESLSGDQEDELTMTARPSAKKLGRPPVCIFEV